MSASVRVYKRIKAGKNEVIRHKLNEINFKNSIDFLI